MLKNPQRKRKSLISFKERVFRKIWTLNALVSFNLIRKFLFQRKKNLNPGTLRILFL